jgi:PPOX class probable FMN-dependent enzyme
MNPDPAYTIATASELQQLYGEPSERARLKQLDRLDVHCRAFIAAAPFVTVGTYGTTGADCSPRGGYPGFVRVLDEHTLLIPDHVGNNRIDSLRNVLECGSVGLLFLVPGVGETLRVNGNGKLSVDPALLALGEEQGKLPRCVLLVAVREAFIHCSRALVRAKLWDASTFLDRSHLPTMGTMLAAHTHGQVEASSYDEGLAARVRETLY